MDSNNRTMGWRDSDYYRVNGAKMVFITIHGEDFICPPGDTPKRAAKLREWGYTVTEPKTNRDTTARQQEYVTKAWYFRSGK
jgi:hypothetical protein